MAGGREEGFGFGAVGHCEGAWSWRLAVGFGQGADVGFDPVEAGRWRGRVGENVVMSEGCGYSGEGLDWLSRLLSRTGLS